MKQYANNFKKLCLIWMIGISCSFSSCYTYHVGTYAQSGSELSKPVTANSYFWGLLKKPKDIDTPLCDSLGVNGMSDVIISSNFGYSLITVATLGIWSPIKVQYRCGKPCKKTGGL